MISKIWAIAALFSVQGVQRECTYDEIVDWRVYTREESYSPDNIYKYMK